MRRENRAKGSRLTGYWKVYGDVNAAKNVLKHSGNVQTISAGSLNADTLFYSLRLIM